MARSDLPFGSEFSPQQVSLATLLDLADEHGSDWAGFEDAVHDRYFSGHATTEKNRRKLANNTKLSLHAYGIIRANDDATLTDLGRALHNLRDQESALHEALARHILKDLYGASFVQCILDMQAAGEDLTLITLRKALGERGLSVPRGTKHMSTVRLWLEQAGVFTSGYQVDRERFRELLGITDQDLNALAMLTPEQRAYLNALANVGGGGPHRSNDLEKLAAATYPVEFNEKGLARQVLYPLRNAGYIALERGTDKVGRGAKPFFVSATEQLDTEVISPLLDQFSRDVRADLRPLLRKPLKEIRAELRSPDPQLRGLALEVLAFKLMRSVGLHYVGTRVRGKDTGGAEVDLVFDSDRLVFSRWQIQCKNTKRVKLDDIAKEVGLTHTLKSNAVAIVTTGEIGVRAREYATQVMQTLNLCIICIEGADLKLIEERPTAIVDVLAREAQHAMDLKKLDM